MENKIYVEVEENERMLFNEISELTMTNYELKENSIPIDSLIPMIKDIMVEYHNLQEQLEDLKRDMEDNYRPIPLEEQI